MTETANRIGQVVIVGGSFLALTWEVAFAPIYRAWRRRRDAERRRREALRKPSPGDDMARRRWIQ